MAGEARNLSESWGRALGAPPRSLPLFSAFISEDQNDFAKTCDEKSSSWICSAEENCPSPRCVCTPSEDGNLCRLISLILLIKTIYNQPRLFFYLL